RLLRPIPAAGLFPVGDAERIEDAADDFVADAGEVADTAAADEDDRVFLKVVSFARDVRCDFLPVRETDAGHFPERRIGLLGCYRFDLQTNAALLRAPVEDGGFGFGLLDSARFAHKLVD